MGQRSFRVLFVASHPVQYAAPIFRLFAKHPQLDPLVAYCSLQGAEKGLDPEFGVEIAWDVPLLDGYPWVLVPNRARKPGIGRFWGLINPGLWKLVRSGSFDAVVIYTGYVYSSFWIVTTAAKLSRIPLLFGTDAVGFRSIRPRWWKSWTKPLFLPRVFSLADVVLSTSAATSQFFRSMGISSERIVLTPFVADNDWWKQRAAAVDRAATRNAWGIPEAATVFLFCAKLQEWKRPFDALRAFARLGGQNSCLVLAGDGPLHSALEAEAGALGISQRVRLLGFVNQTQLPGLYCSADLLLLTSEYDACPVVVCEAMLCGCPVILSDAIRGRLDLVNHGVTGFVYPCGDVNALAQVMRDALANPSRLSRMSIAARRRMETWSLRENVQRMIEAVDIAVSLKKRGRG